MVSPANSFDLMDGGLDMEISRYYGGVASLVPVVRAALVEDWCGQQNVGTCLLVDAQKLVQTARQGEQAKSMPRYIAHVPTMRVPKVLHPRTHLGLTPEAARWQGERSSFSHCLLRQQVR
jgi:O-acetyl-ADP-ribose deacetylase (regulator of RNase III)